MSTVEGLPATVMIFSFSVPFPLKKEKSLWVIALDESGPNAVFGLRSHLI